MHANTITSTALIDRTGLEPPGTSSPEVRLRLIGGFELEIDGEPVEVQPAVQRLAALVALAPRAVSREFAAFQLWPDKPEARAKANLRSTIWRLNQLDAEVVRASPTRLRLASDVWLDTRDAIEPCDPDLDVPRPFGTMLFDLLPDWYDDWLVIERERFRQLTLASLDERARSAIAAGDSSCALQCALGALAIDGTRESSHRLVVQAHLFDGNEREAARERTRYTDSMNACLG